MRFNPFSVLSGAALALMFAVLPASAWDLKAMNKQIDETNVIVSSICSGTVISVEKRLILTANHCITDNVSEVEVKSVDIKTGEVSVKRVQKLAPMYIETWKRQDYDVVTSERHSAVIVGFDAASDTAILRVVDINWKPAAAAPLAPDTFEYQRGKTVFAVGNPAIVFDNSVTTGIISAPMRKEDFGGAYKIPLFQHSASTMGGNSGGAIYNDEGQLIGTVTGGVKGADISLAVPISFTKALLRRLGLGDVITK